MYSKLQSTGFETTASENGKKGWEFPLPDKGQAADSGREVSQAQHFSCLCTLWFGLVEAGNYPLMCVYCGWSAVTVCAVAGV